jgi:hypothetical protein
MGCNGRGSRAAGGRRQGAGVAAMIVMMAVINLAVVGAISASGDEAQIGAMRAETARAFYAAESGARVVVKLSSEGLALPAAGDTLSLGTARATYVTVPASGLPGDALIQGRDGTSARRLKVTLSDF